MATKAELEAQLDAAADAWEEREKEFASRKGRKDYEKRQASVSETPSVGNPFKKKSAPSISGIPGHVKNLLPDSRLLVSFMIISFVVVALGDITQGEVPHPSNFLALMVVFLVLGFAAEFSPGTAKVATAFGGLVLLVILMNYSPAIVKGLGFLTGTTDSEAGADSASTVTGALADRKNRSTRPGAASIMKHHHKSISGLASRRGHA